MNKQDWVEITSTFLGLTKAQDVWARTSWEVRTFIWDATVASWVNNTQRLNELLGVFEVATLEARG